MKPFKRRQDRSTQSDGPRTCRARAESENGLALVLVLSLIGVVLAMLAEVLFESEVVSRAAIGERDRARAEMAATTGSQLALFFVNLDAKLRGLSGNSGLPDAAKGVVGAIKQNIEEQMGGRSLAQMLNDFPIGSEGFEAVESFAQLNLSKLADEQLIAALNAVPGYFVVHVSDESAKLNVNLLGDRSLSKHMRNALIRMFSGRREKEFLETYDMTPEQLTSYLQDYVDGDRNDSSGGGDEGAVYLRYELGYMSKNAPLESLDELRRVPGFHFDEIFDVFSPYLTVWPLQADRGQWNINKAPNELVAAITSPPETEVNDPLMDKLEDRLAGGEEFSKKDERSFFDFFKTGGNTDKDTEEILRWIAGYDSSVYRIVVRGVSNQVERTLELVAIYEETTIGATTTGQNEDNPDEQNPPPAEEDEAQPGQPTPPPKKTDPKKPTEGKIRVVYQRFR